MSFVRRRMGEILLLCTVVVCALWLKALLLATPPVPNLYPSDTRLSSRRVELPPAPTPLPEPDPIQVVEVPPIRDNAVVDGASGKLRPTLRAIRDEVVAEFKRQCADRSFSPTDFLYGDTWLEVALSDPSARAQFRAYLFGLHQTRSPLQDHLLKAAMGAVARTNPGFFQSLLRDATASRRWDVASAAIGAGFVAGMDAESFLTAAGPIAANSQEGQYSVVQAIWRQYQEADTPESVGAFLTNLLEQPSADLGALQFANFAVEHFATREAWVDYVARVGHIANTTDDIGRARIAAVQIMMSSYETEAINSLEIVRDRCDGAIAGIGAMVASPWPLLQYMGAIQFDQLHQELLQVSTRQ